MNREKNKNSILQKKYLISLSMFIIIILSAFWLYSVLHKKETNDIFTRDFKNQILETWWGGSIKVSKDDFTILYNKLENVNLTETDEISYERIPKPSFTIKLQTEDERCSVTIIDNYIIWTTNIHLAADILGEESKMTFYKTSKNLNDQESKRIYQKYMKLFLESSK